jgi:hypothetical protein
MAPKHHLAPLSGGDSRIEPRLFLFQIKQCCGPPYGQGRERHGSLILCELLLK